MAEDRSVLIVGGGIAGLSCGCYAQMNGYHATVLEMHKIPGGLCTAWKREGYTFDISMHMLVGSRSGPVHRMWRELGAIEGRTFHYHSLALRVEDGAKVLEIRSDPERLERGLLALSPADAARSRELVRLVFGRSMMNALPMNPWEVSGWRERLRTLLVLLPQLPMLVRCGNKTFQEFAEGFKDPFLREAVRFIADSPGWPMPRFPMAAMSGFLPGVTAEAGVPIGGSMKVVLTIAERLRELGGEVRCDRRVTDILIEGGRAVGVRLADGSELRAGNVVWAADGHTLLFDVLKGRHLSDRIQRMYKDWVPVQPLVQVCLGVARDMTREPPRLAFVPHRPIVVGGEERRWVFAIHHAFDPTMAPPGKAAMEVWYPTKYAYWRSLAEDRPRYDAEKQRIAQETIAALDERWPGLADRVEHIDVCTPTTYVRYTGNWQGSPDGWYMTPENMTAEPELTLPGLQRFYMAGQWTAPFAGTVISALTGRQVAQLLCHRDGRSFVTTEP